MHKAIFTIWIVVLAVFSVFANTPDGGGKAPKQDARRVNVFQPAPNQVFSDQDDFLYSTTTYTFGDLVVFSYFDDSQFFILAQDGSKIDSVILQNNQYYVFSPGDGIYQVVGNKSFSLLIGDPVSANVLGYFAVDESGSPLSTRLNTYMPTNYWGGEHFILFAYNDGTEFAVKNLSDNTIISAGVLNKGEHLQLDGYYGVFLGVEANKPVSALSYTDQGYFIPSTNGTFAGTEFYGFSGYVGSWPNGIIITAYSDSTTFLIVNSATGDTIATDTLDTGEVFSYAVYQDVYWQVMTNHPVTVCNSPYAAYSGYYYYLTRQIDESGRGIGTNFYTPVIAGTVNIFSFEDGNEVLVINTTTQDTVWQGTLDAYQEYSFSSSYTVYHITGSKNLAVISSYGGGWGADFVPLNFSLGLPDVALSSNNIYFDPDTDKRAPGDPITLSAMVHNWGYQTAYNVAVQFYDGDPEGGQAISSVMIADSIPAGDSAYFQQQWTVPDYPEYHAVYVIVDQENTIRESNESNNMSFKFIIPNDDLLPPLSTIIDAPVAVNVVGDDSLEFDSLDIRINLVNTGTVDAPNARAILSLPPGMKLTEDSQDSILWDVIPASQHADSVWHVVIDSLIDGDAYFYSILVESDSSAPKIVERMLLINRPVGINERTTDGKLPAEYFLSNNYPNPFNPVTHFDVFMKKQANLQLDVYSINGQKIATLFKGSATAGKHSFTFNGAKYGSGVYFVRMRVDGKDVMTRKMMMLK